MKSLGLGCCLVLVAACGAKPRGGPPLTAAETQQLRDLVGVAQAKASTYASARERGLREAWRTLDPAAATGPCAVPLPKLPLLRGYADQTSAEREALDVAHWRMTVVDAGAVLGQPPPPDEKMMQKIEREMATKGPRRDQFDRQSEMVLRIASEAKVPETFKDAAEVIALATELGSEPYWGWELVIISSEHRHPLFNPSGFQPGLIEGKAFVWSFKDGRVVCAASVSATNQDKLKVELDPNEQRMQRHQVLDDDLANQAYRAAIEAMKAVPAS